MDLNAPKHYKIYFYILNVKMTSIFKSKETPLGDLAPLNDKKLIRVKYFYLGFER